MNLLDLAIKYSRDQALGDEFINDLIFYKTRFTAVKNSAPEAIMDVILASKFFEQNYELINKSNPALFDEKNFDKHTRRDEIDKGEQVHIKRIFLTLHVVWDRLSAAERNSIWQAIRQTTLNYFKYAALINKYKK